MGREIRMVPPNWEPPRTKCEHSPWAGGCNDAKNNNGMCLKPHYDKTFKEAAKEWKEDLAAWERGERPSYFTGEYADNEFWEYNSNPPTREYYRPEWSEPATWFVVYETVSEGTPVTPAFATKQELIEYLVANGDYWAQSNGEGGWGRSSAEAFVNDHGFAPSMIVSGGIIYTPGHQEDAK